MLQFANHFLLRVTALPFSALEALTYQLSLSNAVELDRLESLINSEKDQLCNRLYEAIQAQQIVSARHALMSVKRDVFNCRLDSTTSDFSRLEQYPSLKDGLKTFDRRLRELESLRRRAEDDFLLDSSDVFAAMANLWRVPEVQTGVLFAQPRLYRELDALFSNEEPQVWSKEIRRLVQTAVSYFHRVATKTSPFSAFTRIAVGRLDDVGSKELKVNGSTSSSFTINAGTIQAWVRRAVSNDDIRRHQPLVVNHTLQLDNGQAYFLAWRRRTANGNTNGEESLLSLALNPLIELVLQVVETHPEKFTRQTLLTYLASLSLAKTELWEGVVDQMIDSELLQGWLGYDANSIDVVSQLRASAVLGESAMGRRVAGAWSAIDESLGSLSEATIPQAAELLSKIALDVSEAFKVVGANPNVNDQTLVHHHSHVSSIGTLPRSYFRGFEGALRRLAGLMPMLNAELQHRERITQFFLKEYGTQRCENVFDFFRRFCESAVNEGSSVDTSKLFDPGKSMRMEQATETRKSFVADLRRRLLNAHSSEFELTSAFLEEWTQATLSLRPTVAPASFALMAQIIGGPSGAAPSQLVLNKIVPGYGTLFAPHAAADTNGHEGRRWLRDSLRKHLADLDPDATIAEFVGTFGFDGQIRPPITESCLIYPGEETRQTSGRAIPWQSLAILWDEERGGPILLDKRNGRRVIPLHLGTLSAVYLPPFFRVIMAFGPSFSPYLQLLDLLETDLSETQLSEVRHYPRIVHQNIVLMRAAWCIPARKIPRKEKWHSDFSYFQCLRRWSHGLGLPRRGFVTPMLLDDYLQSDLSAEHFRRLHKPFYVDWDNFQSHQLFRRYTKVITETLTFSEMLPTPEVLWPSGRVTELVMEVYESDN